MTEYISDKAKQDACDMVNELVGGGWAPRDADPRRSAALYALALKFQQTGDYPDKWTLEARKICAEQLPAFADEYHSARNDENVIMMAVKAALRRGAEMAGEV